MLYFALRSFQSTKVLSLMRNVQIKQLLYFVWLGGCGASTGLDAPSESKLPSTTYIETGGIAYGGAGIGLGGTFSGGMGGTFDVLRPTGGAKAVGGAKTATGGASYVGTGGKVVLTGGATYVGTGGAIGVGGSKVMPTGGAKATGGYVGIGGMTYTGTGGSTVTGTMKIATDGYASIPAGLYLLHGYIYSFAGGSMSYIQLDYSTYQYFCAKGDVAANPTYVSYAGAGVDVNQVSASSGSTVDSLVIDAKYIVVSFTNQAGSPLRVQLNDASNNDWCYDISDATSPVTIPLTSFNTRCWDNSGAAFMPGTAITTIQLLVPGDSVVDRPFNFCLLGVTFI